MNYIETKFANREIRMRSKIKINQTVNQIHNNKLKYFEKLHSTILDEKMKLLEKNKNDQYLKKEIDEILSRKEETEYYLDTSEILMKLEDLENTDQTTSEYNSIKKELMNDYFDVTDTSLKDLVYSDQYCKGCKSDLRETENEYNSCINCGTEIERVQICSVLGFNEKKDVTIKISVHYKRINYFIEWLNQIQAKETTEIPVELKKILLLEIAKENINDMRKLTIPTIRRLLKKCGQTKYYEHTPLIITELNGLPPLQIPEQIEEMLKFMFKEIQDPWEKFKCQGKNNFFSYPYTLYKFCQLLGMTELLPYFPLLKSRDKLYAHDILWKKIMNYLVEKNKNDTERKLYDIPWKFIPIV